MGLSNRRKLLHDIGYGGEGIWRCSKCWYTPRVEGTIPKAVAKERCPGRVVKLMDLVGDPQGHVLVFGEGAVSGQGIVWCIRCGYYAHVKPRNLMHACKGTPQTEAAKRTLAVTAAGKDPDTDEPLCGQGHLRYHQFGEWKGSQAEYE